MKYETILHHEHRISSKRQPMSLHDRAAQFAPFAALNGHEEEIEEAARQVESQEVLSEDAMEKLNQALQYLCENPYSGCKYTSAISNRTQKNPVELILPTPGFSSIFGRIRGCWSLRMGWRLEWNG